jgi:hypothetical protein
MAWPAPLTTKVYIEHPFVGDEPYSTISPSVKGTFSFS